MRFMHKLDSGNNPDADLDGTAGGHFRPQPQMDCPILRFLSKEPWKSVVVPPFFGIILNILN